MKKVFIFIMLCSFSFLLCKSQNTKQKSLNFQSTKSYQTLRDKSQSFPDRSKQKRLLKEHYQFNNKRKISIDDEIHWYALENRDNKTYWENVNCKKLLIEFDKNTNINDQKVKGFLQRFSLSKVIDKSLFPEFQNFFVFQLPNGDKNKILTILEEASKYEFILYAEPFIIYNNKGCQPNDTWYYLQWGPYVILADSVWCYYTGGSNNWLAVIDDACEWNHEDLINTVRYGYDFAMNDADPGPDNGQEHGTHVTGTVGATINNSKGVAGMLNDTIYFAKVTDNTSSNYSESAIINALNTIATIPQIRAINMSFGGYGQSTGIETAIQNAYNNGKLLIAAAGNDNVSTPMYPAAYSVVISVSAIGVDGNGNLNKATYSNYGSTIDISAPGGENSTGYPIISTLPNNTYGGSGWEGTSMASPHVAGVVGQMFAINPLLTVSQARTILEQQVFDMGTPGWDQYYGSGMVCSWCAFEAACMELTIPITANGPTNICSGGSVKLDAPYHPDLSYQWKKNGINIAGATSNSYTVSQEGIYRVQVHSLGGVCQKTSDSIVVTITPLPVNAGAISGNTNVCQGQLGLTYTVPIINNANSYVWSLPIGATGSSSTNTITVDFGTSAVSGNISVKGSNACGDGAPSSLPITINNLPSSAGIISGNTIVCQGQNNVTYTVPIIPEATSYTWTLPGGATGSSTTNSITVNFGTSATSGNISVKGTNSCGDGPISHLPITVNTIPSAAGTISGNTNVCQGQNNVTYTVPIIPEATSYTWSLPGGATGSSNSNTISVNYSISAVSGNITVYGANSCGNGPISTLAISVNTVPQGAGTISGNTSVCQGQTDVAYSVPPIANATSYIWNLPTGATGSSNTNTINVSYGAFAVSGNISVKGSNSCGDGASSILPITVNVLPDGAGIITGNSNVCQGQTSVIYTVPLITNANSYIWSLPSGASGTSISNTISVDFSNTAISGNISVKGSNNCGDGPSSILPITINPLPLDAGSITGSISPCQGQSNVLYSVPSIAYANSYLWTLPNGATGSSTTNSISVDYGTSAQSGNITVQGSNTCGVGLPSSLQISINPLPSDAGAITGSTTVCQGQSLVSYAVPTIPNAINYLWTLPNGATGSSNSNIINIDFGLSAISGDISVRGNNICGDGVPSSLSITVNPKPPKPTITLNGNILHSDATNGNQWYDQNGAINGATNQDFTATVDGEYYVIVTLAGCSSDPSNKITFTVSGIEDINSDKIIQVYPNPAKDNLFIKIPDYLSDIKFELLNSHGQKILKKIISGKFVVNIDNLPPGIYIIKFEIEDSFEFTKFVKE